MENRKIRGLIQEIQYSYRCSIDKEENEGEKSIKERIDGNEGQIFVRFKEPYSYPAQ